MNNDRVLVTGASGLVGRALVEKLRSDGVSVIGVGRSYFCGGREHSWRLGVPLGDALNEVDVVVHLAAHVHVRGKGFSDEERFVRENA